MFFYEKGKRQKRANNIEKKATCCREVMQQKLIYLIHHL